MSVPMLLLGREPQGGYRCFYCGAACGEGFLAKDHVRTSFTGIAGVSAPGSEYVCEGCVACLDEKAKIRLIDGEVREHQKIRNYSWIVTNGHPVAATKRHLDQIRATCLCPPEPPFAIVIADSGQKQLLYRGVVCRSNEHVSLTLEEERISYRIDALHERLVLVGRWIAAIGKPAMTEPITPPRVFALAERYRDWETLLERRRHVDGHPLTRLAVWLSPGKDECQREHPGDVGHRTVSSKTGRTGRSESGLFD